MLADSRATESDHQETFEAHPAILETIGYIRWLPRPRLPLDAERYLEPDFLAERPDSRVEVVELKTPYENLTVSPDRRERFTAKMTSYVSQVHEYDEYFDDRENRQRCEELHGLVAKHPPKLIVVGRDENVDKLAIWRQEDRLASSITVMTYDDIRSALLREHAKLTVTRELLEGATFFVHLEFSPLVVDRRKYLLDLIGDACNRLSVYLDAADVLVLEVTTGDGRVLQAPTMPRAGVFEIGPPILLQYDIGSSHDAAILQMRVEDRIAAELRIPGLNLGKELSFVRGVIGNSVDYTAGGAFALRESTWYTAVPDFRDRLRLVEYFFNKRIESSAAVVFSGEQAMDVDLRPGADRTARARGQPPRYRANRAQP